MSFRLGNLPTDRVERAMSEWERELLNHFLSISFRGQHELLEQSKSATVKTIMPDGTFNIFVKNRDRAHSLVDHAPLLVVQGTYEKEDVYVHACLFTDPDGFLTEMEVIIIQPPNAVVEITDAKAFGLTVGLV